MHMNKNDTEFEICIYLGFFPVSHSFMKFYSYEN